MPFVVKLKIRLPVMAARVDHGEHARQQRPRQVDHLLRPPGRRHVLARHDQQEQDATGQRDHAGHGEGDPPAGILHQEAREHGTTAMPRLPASPLRPIVKPGFFTLCTSIGIPTGC